LCPLSVALALAAAPYLLGRLADYLGLRAAFSTELALIAISGLLLLTGLKAFVRTSVEAIRILLIKLAVASLMRCQYA
jgi:hypothetical protein